MKTITVSWDRFLKVERDSKEALRLASKHDPDLLKMIRANIKLREALNKRLNRLIDHVNREIGVSQKIPLCQRIKK